jgi:uncharacterized membrane protein
MGERPAMEGREVYRPQPGGSFEFNRPIVVALLLLLTYFTFSSGLIGLAVAYVWRKDAREEWEATHYRYLIRSVWLALAYLVGSAAVVGLFAAVISTANDAAARGGNAIGTTVLGLGLGLGAIGGVVVFLGTAIWFAVRCVLSIVNAMPHQPMPRPATWWL